MAKIHRSIPTDGDGIKRKSQIFIKLRKYIGNLPENLSDARNNQRFSELFHDRKALLNDVDRIEKTMDVNLNGCIVFCHNDLLLKNILYDVDNGI
jgi:thiamine kinase-like enzyme